MKKLKYLAIPCAALTSAVLLLADEKEQWKLPPETARFKTGPDAELVTANCLLCHSADYVSMQPPLERAAWTAIVEKMRKTYGAPLPEEQVGTVVDYLVAQYGVEPR